MSQPSSPVEEVKGMVVRRMSNHLEERRAEKRYAKESVDVERERLEKQMAEKDDAMLDLQRRVLGEIECCGDSLEWRGNASNSSLP